MTRTSFLAIAIFAAGLAASSVGCGGGGASLSDFNSGGGGAGGGAGGGDGNSGGTFGSSGAGGTGGQQQVEECKKMDILFVVDNSGSMDQEQANLAKNFPSFVNVINTYKTKSGADLDYRIAVTSSDDKKDKGKFQVTAGEAAPPACIAGPARPWLERPDGDVSGFFSCRARVGIEGTGTERPLESALLGVTARIADGTNASNGAGFVRDDALFAMVILSDEDEGSAGGKGDLARPMADYPGEFDKVKGGERGRWATAVIAGPNNCSSPGLGNAKEAVRLKQFVSTVGKNGVFASICTGDLTDGLTKALQTFDQACKDFPTGPVK